MADADGRVLRQEQQKQQADLIARLPVSSFVVSAEEQKRQSEVDARQRQLFQTVPAEQHRQATASTQIDDLTPAQRKRLWFGFPYGDLPRESPDDPRPRGPVPAHFEMFESVCRESPLSTVQSIVNSQHRSPAFLHQGLTVALSTGRIEIASYLLSAGAPIVRGTPQEIFSAPPDQQIPLFELLTHHGWTLNTPSYYGRTLISRIVSNLPLLSWFLAHGANPNLGQQLYFKDRLGGPNTESCKALESAAYDGNVEAVRMLLDAGAEIRNGVPLHSAAGKRPPGANCHYFLPPSKDFDLSMIPVMELLVERGADVNGRDNDRHVVPRYAIARAVNAGAVERVRWLLEHGANLELESGRYDPVQMANWQGEEMKKVVEEGVAARRWIKDDVTAPDVT